MRVNPRDHCSPLTRLIVERFVVGVCDIGLVPVWKDSDIAERRVRYLDGEEAEKGLAGFVVVVALGANEVERGEGVGVIAVGGIGIVDVVLQRRRVWIVRTMLIAS